jgi:hypothetical protein
MALVNALRPQIAAADTKNPVRPVLEATSSRFASTTTSGLSTITLQQYATADCSGATTFSFPIPDGSCLPAGTNSSTKFAKGGSPTGYVEINVFSDAGCASKVSGPNYGPADGVCRPSSTTSTRLTKTSSQVTMCQYSDITCTTQTQCITASWDTCVRDPLEPSNSTNAYAKLSNGAGAVTPAVGLVAVVAAALVAVLSL